MNIWQKTTFSAFLGIGICLVGTSSFAVTSLSGVAELSYVNYDASVAGQQVLQGTSLAQHYSVMSSTTNRVSRWQQQYYDINLGYEWAGFQTRVTDADKTYDLKQSYGKIKYNGDLGYVSPSFPIKARLYINDDTPTLMNRSIGTGNLIDDTLVYDIPSKVSRLQTGFSFEFEPYRARVQSLRELPRFLIAYNEVNTKGTVQSTRVDSRGRDLSVAGLNKENNWINFRFNSVEDFIDPSANFTRQQLQIGHVDNTGRRKWAMLTNWIEVSADGQLTTYKSADQANSYEEYDLNFMSVATRRTWSARSFTNYNRRVESSKITENASLPVYVKGTYGADTDWYVNVSTRRGREITLATNGQLPTFTNYLAIGGTTFKRSSFTLTPAMSFETSRDIAGNDSYAFSSSLESNSTNRFSSRLGLAGKALLDLKNDGMNTVQSKSWHGLIELRASYKPDYKFNYNLQQHLESGSGSGYINSSPTYTNANQGKALGNYYRSYSMFSVSWTPSNVMSSDFRSAFNAIVSPGVPVAKEANLDYTFAYIKSTWQLKAVSKYSNTDNGINPARVRLDNALEAAYRPNRNQDSLLRISQNSSTYGSDVTRNIEALQRYSYNLFTRTGVNRNLATISEEFKLTDQDTNGRRLTSRYLMLSGRYSPTEKVSLFGSAKYESTDPNITVLFYNAGINADFKLLTTSIDYSYAKRDSDNRIEKKLAATVKRVF